jgi:hypothetical protein
MKLKSGEQAHCDAETECARCGTRTFVSQGQDMPRCAECQGEEFDNVRQVSKRMVFLWHAVPCGGAPTRLRGT